MSLRRRWARVTGLLTLYLALAGQSAYTIPVPPGPLFSCFLQAVTVITECQPASAGLRVYVSTVSLSNQVATVQTLDVIAGTGVNCAVVTATLTHKFQFGTLQTTTNAFVVGITLPQPLVPPVGSAICIRPSAATAFGGTLTGYIAP